MRCYSGARLDVLPLQQHVVILCVFQNCPAGTNFRVEEKSGCSVKRRFQVPTCVTLQRLKRIPPVPRTSSARAKQESLNGKRRIFYRNRFLHFFRILVQVKFQLVLGLSLSILDRLTFCFKTRSGASLRGAGAHSWACQTGSQQSCGCSLSYSSLPYLTRVNASAVMHPMKNKCRNLKIRSLPAPAACRIGRDVSFTENYSKSTSPQVLL